VAQDHHVLEAINDAYELGIAQAILIGEKIKIEAMASEIYMDLTRFEVIDESNNNKAALKAVELVSSGHADMVMKGLIDTATFLRAVLNKEVGLRTGKLMSHVAVFEIDNFDRLLFLTDAAFNMYPDLKEKIDMVHNAVLVAKAVGVENPKVAPVCAVEVVNPGMQATIDASSLTQMNNRGQINGCIIDGPMALDIAISEEAAHLKGVTGPVAGNADILLAPNIEAGNMLYKSLTQIANCKNGALLVGTSAPVVLTSRSDSHESKMYSIALAALVANEISKNSLKLQKV
jgi:phosphate butyryltransferase